MQEMVNVVAPVSATVEAPPEREFCEKLPSGEDSKQFVTPCEFQNIEVREPSGTDAGTAHISTFGGTAGVVLAAPAGFDDERGALCTIVTVGTTGCGVPTWYPRSAHRLSKNVGGSTYERKLLAHGRLRQRFAMTLVG